MQDLLTLTCPTCGAKLKLANHINLLVCANCGNEHMVNRGDGAIYLVPMAEDMRHIRTGVDKTAAELAVARLQKEVEDIGLQFIRAEESDYVLQIPPSALEGLGLGIVVTTPFVGLFFLFSDMQIAAVICGVIFAVALLAVNHARGKRVSEAKRRKYLDLDNLQLSLNEKMAALQKNRLIANS